MRTVAGCCGLFLLLAACGFSPTTPKEQAAPSLAVLERWRAGQSIRVVVLGNSISLGSNADGWERIRYTADGHLTPESQADDSVQGVVTQLRRMVRTKNAASVVTNESGDGYTTLRTLMWLENVLSTSPKYDLAFIPLQVNDAKQGVSITEFTDCTQQIIDHLAAAGILPVLVKENDIYSDPELRFGTPFSAFMTAVDELAAYNHISVVDGYTPFHTAVLAGGGIESCGLFDTELQTGVHPNQAGHDLLFRAYEQWFNR